MRQQIPLHHNLRVWATSPSAIVAAKTLGMSPRTLYYRIEKASRAELRDAFAKLQADARVQLAVVRKSAFQLLLARNARLADLTRQMDALSQEKDTIERQRAILARENDALRDEVQRLTLQGPRPTYRRGPTDDPYAILHVTSDAPPEVLDAVYRALAKIHHPDVGGSDAAMKRINIARAAILQRNGHVK
jgi:hypothetical protein